MTVYVTGDVHGGADMQKLRDWDLGESLTSDDYLIIAGDFGFPWDFSAEECADIAWLESRPYTVLFVDGNHERFDHWAERPMELWHGGLTQRLSDTSPIRRLTRGEVFELDGSTIFTMGGATSVDKEYRIPYSSWWPQELPDERNLRRRGQSSTAWVGRSTMRSPIPAPRACFRPRFTRHLAGIIPMSIDSPRFSTSWRTTWTTSAGTTGIFIVTPTQSSATPCSTTVLSAWATNSSPGMSRRGGVAGYSTVTVMFSRCVRITSQLKCSTSCSAERGVASGAMPVCPASQQ